jgi:hypothetical protein
VVVRRPKRGEVRPQQGNEEPWAGNAPADYSDSTPF